MHYSVHFGNEQ